MSDQEDKLTPDQIDQITKGTGENEQPAGEDASPKAEPEAQAATDADARDGGVAQAVADPPPSLQPGELTKPAGPDGQPLDLDFILDIPLQMTVEVGRTRMLIQELLQLVLVQFQARLSPPRLPLLQALQPQQVVLLVFPLQLLAQQAFRLLVLAQPL